MDLRNSEILRTGSFINGQWLSSESGKTLAIHNPATGQLVASVADLDASAAKIAIKAAYEAYKSWGKSGAKYRAKILRRWCELLLDNCDDLAFLLSCEQGKPLAEARAEIRYGANYVSWFSEEATRIYGDVIAPPSADRRLLCIREPVGVVAAITPWNFPNAMLARKIAPALAAGCTMVCKPAPNTPLSALALAALGEKAGIPKGVLNVIVGSDAAAIGHEMTKSELVRKITFTGSTAVGRKLLAQSAASVKKTSMELGGNAPFIVFADADIEQAVTGAMASKFRNAGQTCISANRFLIHEGVLEDFLAKLLMKVEGLRLGNGVDEGVTMGPLIDLAAMRRVHEKVQQAIDSGATLVTGGKPSSLGGSFYAPTILTGVRPGMRVFEEEIFGPVAAITSFQTEEEAISMANATHYGLAGYFYTASNKRIFRLAEEIECGIIGVNEGLVSNEMVPFGGIKQSGLGREGSKYGLEDYMEIKYLCLGGLL